MFFYLSKIISFLVSPTVWIAMLLIASLIVRNERLRKKILIASLVFFLFFTNRFLFTEVARSWEIPAVSQKQLKQYDGAIVLGGMINYDPQLDRLQFSQSNDRMMQAVELYKRGYVKKIIFTGGSGSITFQQYKEGAMVKRFYGETLGIPEDDLIIENESKNTYENAVFTKKIITEQSPELHSFLLITSGYHMRRSLACFKKQNIDGVAYSTDRISGDRLFLPDHLFVPNYKALEGWDILLHEWVGCIMYKIAGYI